MDAGRQRIIFYFIEEAKEHLDTLEKGLVDLAAVMADEEWINEMFRAAHSVKGGAAQLGFDSIMTTAHRLEDCFKILKDHRVKVDQKMVSMFLIGYDTLHDLVERLQGPFGLREEEAYKIVQKAEPNFAQLQAYLNKLVAGGGGEIEKPASPLPKATVSRGAKTPATNVAAQVTEVLKQMLQLFKEQETPQSRQQLAELCKRLLPLGNNIETWQTLVKTVYRAIANPDNSYRTLAPVVIKEIKQGSTLLTAGKATALAPSANLKQLAPAPQVAKTPPPAKPKEITVPVEPRAAAKALMQAFNKKQLSELVALLQKVVR